jgi:hypothetical protein
MHLGFPTPLMDYPQVDGGLLATLAARIEADPFNAIATGIFALAVLHTFAAARFTALAHRLQQRHDDRAAATRAHGRPSIAAELLHFVGEVEVVFGLWALVLLGAIVWYKGAEIARHYVNDTVTYTEPMFVVVIMTLASTRPIIMFAEGGLRRLASLGGGTPAAWWMAILIIGPLLGSFITEPGAMTICALLLARQFYDLQPSVRLKSATLGLLFVNVSIGGTLTHFAAPPVLMVSRPWGWDTSFMLTRFGSRAALAIAISTLVYAMIFRRELASLADRPAAADVDVVPDDEARGGGLLPVPPWPDPRRVEIRKPC